MINVFQPNSAPMLRDTTRPGEFAWHELVTMDRDGALAFYAKVFGWKKVRDVDIGPMGTYTVFGIDGVEFGGIFTKPKDMPMPPHWLYYVQVAELAPAIERAKAKGAKLLNGPIEVPGGAHVAQLTDPQGAPFALHEEAKKA
jgi:predicted enzyme related to lactoylglutathione lyase